MKISIIIPNWNGMKWLPACLHSVYTQTFADLEVVIVDNASEDHSIAWIEGNYPQVQLVKLKTNTGFARAVNEGIKISSSKYIMLLNTDTELDPQCLESLVMVLEKAKHGVGAVSPLMLSMSNRSTIDDAGDQLSWYGEATKRGYSEELDGYDFPNEIFSPSGGASLYRRSFFDQVGLFDERFFAYLEDVDLGFRGKLLGFSYMLVPDAIVYHQGHGSKIAHGFYIELVTKNRILLFLKNVPFALLLKHSGKLLYGQFYFLLAYGHLLPSIKGYLGAMRTLPSVLRSRKEIRSKTVLAQNEIDILLGTIGPAEGIMFHLKRLWQ